MYSALYEKGWSFSLVMTTAVDSSFLVPGASLSRALTWPLMASSPVTSLSASACFFNASSSGAGAAHAGQARATRTNATAARPIRLHPALCIARSPLGKNVLAYRNLHRSQRVFAVLHGFAAAA